MKIMSIEEAAGKLNPQSRKNKVVIVTGVTGQDGSFMVDYLLKNTDYDIVGGARRLSVSNHENLAHLASNPRFYLINFDLTDAHSINKTISHLLPDYFINFAAQSFVKSSWDFPAQTWDANTLSIIHILESIRLHKPDCRFYNAGSSEEFGDVVYSPQDINHPLRPRSPYGASKAASRQLVKVYRESYNLYALQGWLFNHEGTRRGEEFVTRKITKAVASIATALKNNTPIQPLTLGNLDVYRDWSDAEDCVDAVWRMLNQEHFLQEAVCNQECDVLLNFDNFVPKEYVVSSGKCHTVREFVEVSLSLIGLVGEWSGKGTDEVYNVIINGNPFPIVTIDSAFYRPAEVDKLLGNSSPIRTELGWSPKTDFYALVEKMVRSDIELETKKPVQ